MRAHERWHAYRPRIGDDVRCRGQYVGTVRSVEKGLCYLQGGEPGYMFIWCFSDGLNTLHEWKGKP